MTGDRERFEWMVEPGEARTRLDRFLAERGVLGTRSQVRRLIEAGLARVDDSPTKAGAVLRVGQRVSVEKPAPPSGGVEPEEIPLDVLYEDESILAINKPAGLVVHPAPGHARGTLVGALLHRWRTPPPGFDPARLGIVHRLDKDTSGVLLIAKDVATHAELGRQFQGREVHKRYLALVWGCPTPARGVIDQPIARHPVDRKRMAVNRRGRAALTRYEILEELGGFSLLRLFPETGRTHQIRVHLASIGHPVLADPVYARGRTQRDDRDWMPKRQALHAESIRFRHPQSGQWVTVSAPLPGDFERALGALRASSLTSRSPSRSVRDV